MATIVSDLIEAIMVNEDMKVLVAQSIRGGLVTGLCTFAGGVLGGSRGMLTGAAIGGLYSMAASSSTEMKPAVAVYNELTQTEKTELITSLRQAFTQNAGELIHMAMLGNILQGALNGSEENDIVIHLIKSFFTQKGYQIS